MRDEAGLSQQGLADLSGVSRAMISMIEVATRYPSIDVVYMLASAMGVTARQVQRAVMCDRGL